MNIPTKNPTKRRKPFFDQMALWLKKNLFPNPIQSMISLFVITILFYLLTHFLNWLIIKGVWSGNAYTCRVSEGACLVFIFEKFEYILFGLYPRTQLWRPIVSLILFLSFLYWSRVPQRWSPRLLWRWLKLIIFIGILLKGGILGLENVDIQLWGGLPLTLLLSFFGIIFSYPIGILMALGRTGRLPFLRFISVLYIELIRGVPMISLLFMASVMFPLFLPDGLTIPKLLRAQVAIIMFMSAYMAEVIRAGLLSIDKGQYEAADSLGLTYWQKQKLIILPQALKVVIPPTVNTAIGMFKDTSLVVIIALSDLLMTTKSSLKDMKWLGFSVEAYLFCAFIYFIFCFSMSRYSKRLERDFTHGVSP